ncbi:MAG: PTS glucose transporter subunit IIA, partial [Synergistaceae bacterium]|nr:PTS glucose transporter subunit IIA [Synergistaceae bacterium]
MIGGTIGAVFGAFTGIGATAYGVTGLQGYLTIKEPLQYTILLAISGGLAFIIAYFIWREEEPEIKTAEVKEVKAEVKAEPENLEFLDRVVISSSAGNIYQPVKGKVIAYTEIKDPTFAAGTLGQGVGIEPEDNIVYAPYDGEISSVAESKHAIGITGNDDMELLIHVGIDTVEMNGDGFIDFVAEGDKVTKGQKLMSFDRAKIQAAGKPETVVVLLTNSDDYQDVKFG